MSSSAVFSRFDGIATTRPAHAKLRGEISGNPQPAWLTEAVHATVHGARGLAKVIADALGCREQHVTDLADGTRRVSLKAHEIPALTTAAGSFAVLDALEASVGRVAFRLQTSGAPDALGRKLSAAVKQFGEFLEVTGEALEDGRLQPTEVPDVLREIDELLAALCEYRARLEAQARVDAEQQP